MDLDILNTAASALAAERMRMDVISSNIANINTTHNANGDLEPYKRKVVSFQTILDEKNQKQVGGVSIHEIEEEESPFKMIYDPSHPDADEKGYVQYPNITIEREMVDMATSKASYEANVKAIQVYKAMFNSALEI